MSDASTAPTTHVAELLQYLEKQHAVLLDALKVIPREWEHRRPAPDRWSAAEVVEHLVLVEQRLTSMFETMLRSAPELGPERDASPVLPTIDLTRALDRSRALVAREGTVPTGTMDIEAGLRALDAARADLGRVVMQGEGRALRELVQPHRLFGPMDMYEWIAFVGGHMGRHTLQIREIAVSLRNAPTEPRPS